MTHIDNISMTEQNNRLILERIAIDFVTKHPGVQQTTLNNYIYFMYKRCKDKGIDLQLPYYWGPYGIHVVWKEITNTIKLNNKDAEDKDYVSLGDIDFIGKQDKTEEKK